MALQNSYNCGFELTLDLIGGKWKGMILWYLFDRGTLRYGELSRLIEGITPKMLTSQLKEMCDTSLISRHSYDTIPPKVEYTLTPIGAELGKIFVAMKKWGVAYGKANGVEVKCKTAK